MSNPVESFTHPPVARRIAATMRSVPSSHASRFPLLSIVEEDRVTFWNGDSVVRREFVSGAAPCAVRWNHNGLVAAIVIHTQNTSRIELVSVPSNQILETLDRKNLGGEGSEIVAIRSVVFGGKGRYLCVTTQKDGFVGGSVIIYDLKKGNIARKFDDFRATTPLYACFDVTEQFIYILTETSVQMYHLKESKLVHEISFADVSHTNDMDRGPSGGVVVACKDGVFRCFDANLKNVKEGRFRESIQQVQWFSDSVCAVLGRTRVAVYDVSSMKIKWEADIANATCMAWHKNLVAIGNLHGLVQVYAWQEDVLMDAYQGQRMIKQLSFSPSNHSQQSPTVATTSLPVIAQSVTTQQDEQIIIMQSQLDDLREEMQVNLRSLHVDMLRQFQLQSEDLRKALDRQSDALDLLVADNASLRRENAVLRNELDTWKRESGS